MFGVYLATLYPGLTPIGDASKFAFVGKVLGTPHPPGYPLYVLVSHVVSYLPWGTLAFRMNALSAVFGALTVAGGRFVVRRLGASRCVAGAVALALGFGRSFWSQALYAKVYTLNAALVTLGLLLLLRWRDGRRRADLYGAAALFAACLANHLTVVALLPALVLFVLLTGGRAVLRAGTVGAVVAIALAGLAPYSFILLRTWQGAPYLEARAATLPQLWAVMTARRFAHEIGAFSLGELLLQRVPHIARLVATELTPLGVVLVLVGLARLVAWQRREAVLLGLGAFGVAALTANMGSEEDRGFSSRRSSSPG